MVLGPDIFQAILLKFWLQGLEIGIQVDPDMGRAEHVMFKTGQCDFPGNHTATHPVVALGNQDFQAVSDQERSTNQCVMTAAGDDDVVIRH